MSGHAGFVFAAYAASALVIGAMILWIALGQRARKAELAALEAGGRQAPLGRAMSESPVTKPSRRNWLALLPLILFLGLAAIFLTQLMSGRDTQTLPSALIGQPVPVTNLPPIEALAHSRHRAGGLQGQSHDAQRLRLLVRALPRRASGADGTRQRQALPAHRHQLQGQAGKRRRLSYRTRQSLREDRRGRVRPRRHRLGRLWRAGDLCDRPGRRDPV